MRLLLRTAIILLALLPLGTRAQVTGLAGWNIYLDPGHSRLENMGVLGYSEAEKNLGVALELYDLLMTTTDIDSVFLSRDEQSDQVGLSQRSDMANNALGANQPASWYHSFHSNAGGATANSVLMLWGEYNNGNEKVPKGGKAMSDLMFDHLPRGMRIPADRSIGDCSFYTWSTWCAESGGPYLSVNRRTAMPSELSEAGFHTHEVQNQRNMSAAWKRMEAYTFYWAILDYHGITRPTVGIAAGYIRDRVNGALINGATATSQGISQTTDSYESLFDRFTSDPDLLSNGFYFLEGLTGDSVEIVFSAENHYPLTVTVPRADNFFTFKDVSLDTGTVPTVLPPEITLLPNYPNPISPFNPTTTIRYGLPVDGHVDLRIYDLNGREVVLLAQGEQRAGYHSIVWAARNRTRRKVSSGIYIARLVTPDGVRAIKMVLLK